MAILILLIEDVLHATNSFVLIPFVAYFISIIHFDIIITFKVASANKKNFQDSLFILNNFCEFLF